MRVLIVSSYRDYRADGIVPFVKEQVEAIVRLHNAPMSDERLAFSDERVVAEYYLLRGKGVRGYLREIPALRKKIRDFKPDIIHAHYGLSGLLANLATRRIPVVTTYHGSDINETKAKRFSDWALRLSAWNIFVSQQIMDLADVGNKAHFVVIPCGIELTDDQLQTREEARNALGWNERLAFSDEGLAIRDEQEGKKYVLFAGTYGDAVKGPELAFEGMRELANEGVSAELIELKGYTREEVNRLMCAVDCLLMTSLSEGSPQVIKEAMACGCPIVSTDVGDVAERLNGIAGCFVVPDNELESERVRELAEAMKKAFAFKGKTKGREKVIADGLDNAQIAERIIKIYKQILNV